MASLGFGTVAPAVASLEGRRLASRRATPPSTARVPAATKVVAAKAAEEKGLFDTIFGALYKEEQLLETDPILNKVEGKAAAPKASAAAKEAAAGDDDGRNGGFSFGGLFSKKG